MSVYHNSFNPTAARTAALQFGTPLYLYDEQAISDSCNAVLNMPNPYGLTVRYAMKANSNKSLLRLICSAGLKIDASSLAEVLRAVNAGIAPCDIMLTTQEVPEAYEREQLNELLLKGLKYTVCSLRQLELIAPFAAQNQLELAIRVHPGVGSGESATRNTGDKYSCFGIHLNDIKVAVEYASKFNLVFRHIHVHIGSGGDPFIWRQNIDRELSIIEQHFPHCHTVNFGGGLRVARMPDETAADIKSLGEYAKQQIEAFNAKHSRRLHMEIEPGTFIMANSGYIVTKVIDHKSTGSDGFEFYIVDGGMEVNARPALYGSRHPFYVVSQSGALKGSDFTGIDDAVDAVIAGKCCESGDCQTLDESGYPVARTIAKPEVGDFIVIGGAGAYTSAMSPFNYNSHLQCPEVLISQSGDLRLIRDRQTLAQLVANEL